jgi:hypothetical protein
MDRMLVHRNARGLLDWKLDAKGARWLCDRPNLDAVAREADERGVSSPCEIVFLDAAERGRF